MSKSLVGTTDMRFILGGIVAGTLAANYMTLNDTLTNRRAAGIFGGYVGAAAGVFLHESLSNFNLGLYVFGPPIFGLALPSVL